MSDLNSSLDQLNAASAQLANTMMQVAERNRQQKNYEETLAYNKQLQLDVWRREDTAVQRRVQDLMAAGLNPLLAATGQGAGAGASIPMQTSGAFVTPQVKATRIAEHLIASAQYDMLQSQRYHMDLSNDLLKAQTNIANTEADIRAHDYKILRDSGILSTSSGFSKDIANAINNLSKHHDKIVEAVHNTLYRLGPGAEKELGDAMQKLEPAMQELKEAVKGKVSEAKSRVQQKWDEFVHGSDKHGRGF